LPAGLLLRATDSFGRGLYFGYNAASQLVQVTDPSGLNYRYTYDSSGNLSSVIYPDGYVKQYVYNESAYTGGSSLPNALTGIIDENGNRYATYWYNASGQAVQESLWADSAQSVSVGGSSLSYSTGSTLWTDALGAQRLYGFTSVNGLLVPTGTNQPSGAGCGPASSDTTYDANANALSKIDFDGNQACYAYDTTRNLETARLEGLSSSASCPSSISSYVPVAPQRITQTVWHPTFRIKAREAAPLKITTWVYNGQADPTNGGSVLSCAPSTALLPDGNPIAVLCKKVEQATTDVNGSQGFGATASGAPRVWTYTYNQYGQKLTATGPRGNLATSDPNYAADTTTYQYYASTVAGSYTMGDLQSVTDAAGHVTSYPQYDGNGRVLQVVDPNGTNTTYTYYPRGWLKSKTVTPSGSSTSQVTGYVYDGVGQLKTVTNPDNTTISYTYDNAHRLTNVTDSANDSIAYTLDAMGNRTAEQTKDPSGNLARQITRVYDQLNRLQTVTGALQ
jgi:YD repeat-containing protein